MQGAKDEADGSILRYVTEAEFRRQRRRWPVMTQPFVHVSPHNTPGHITDRME